MEKLALREIPSYQLNATIHVEINCLGEHTSGTRGRSQAAVCSGRCQRQAAASADAADISIATMVAVTAGSSGRYAPT